MARRQPLTGITTSSPIRPSIELGPERFEVRATTAPPEERAELARAMPYFGQQQSLTKREIPIVLFKRV